MSVENKRMLMLSFVFVLSPVLLAGCGGGGTNAAEEAPASNNSPGGAGGAGLIQTSGEGAGEVENNASGNVAIGGDGGDGGDGIVGNGGDVQNGNVGIGGDGGDGGDAIIFRDSWRK